jgi:hypothetical protein
VKRVRAGLVSGPAAPWAASTPILAGIEAAGVTFSPIGFVRQFKRHAALVTGDDIGLWYVVHHGKGNATGAGIAGKFYIQGAFGRNTPDPAPFARPRDWAWSGLSPCQTHQIPDLKDRDRAPMSAKLQLHWPPF